MCCKIRAAVLFTYVFYIFMGGYSCDTYGCSTSWLLREKSLTKKYVYNVNNSTNICLISFS